MAWRPNPSRWLTDGAGARFIAGSASRRRMRSPTIRPRSTRTRVPDPSRRVRGLFRRPHKPEKRGWRRSVVYALLIVVALGINLKAAQRATEVRRIHVPYSPFFLQQVEQGNVVEITSRGSAIQGRFQHAATPNAATNAAPLFETEIPAFANTNQLAQVLQSNRVEVNAQSLDRGLSWWQSLVYGFGPTILILLLLYWFIRRSSRGMLGGLGRSKARRYVHQGSTITFADVAGIDEAKFELNEIV